MTLKDKFQQWFINDEDDEHYEGMVELVSIEHTKIAEEFATGFAEWLTISYPNQRKFLLKQGNLRGFYSTKELLEIYKIEKGL